MNTLNVEKHAAARLNDIHYAEGLILRKRKSDQINPSDLFQHNSRKLFDPVLTLPFDIFR